MQLPIRSHQRETCAVSAAFPRIIVSALLAGVFFLSASPNARSATESWNPGGTGGGNGTWNTSTANWNSGVTWTSSNDALFSGTGGTVTVTNPIANSLTFSASGPYLLTGGTLALSGSNVTVNSNATIASAMNPATNLWETGAGTLALTGSTNLGSNNMTVTLGNVTIANGGFVSSNFGYVDYDSVASNATVTGSNSRWNTTFGLEVGNSGTGTLLITAGGAVGAGEVDIGYNAGSVGSVTVTGSGSVLTNLGNGGLVVAGYFGTGTLLVTDGATVSTPAIDIGFQSGSGTVTVTGSGSTLTTNYFFSVGFFGTGTLLITNGGTVLNSGASDSIGLFAGSSGMVTVSGTGSTWTNDGSLDVGNASRGTLLISGGGAVFDTNGVIANGPGISGTATVSGAGSIWTSGSGEVEVGGSGAGTLQITGGGAVTDGSGIIANSVGSRGMVTVTGTGSTWTNSSSLSVGGTSAGSGGAGLLNINNGGLVSATQTTVWTTGTLAFAGNATLNSLLTVSGGALMAATGTTGTLTIAGAVTLSSSAGFVFNLDSTNGGSGKGSSELLAASVSLSPNSQFTFTDISSDPGSLTPGTEFVAIETTGLLTGTFENLANGSQFTSGPNTYSASYSPNTLTFTVVPEPATWAMMLAGLAFLFLARRRHEML